MIIIIRIDRIIMIQDNCTIHLTESVKATFDELFIVPYSPQLNIPAEGYFGILKDEFKEFTTNLADNLHFHDNIKKYLDSLVFKRIEQN